MDDFLDVVVVGISWVITLSVVIGVLFVLFQVLKSSIVISNWSHLYTHQSFSTEEFYKTINKLLVEHNVPKIKSSYREFKIRGIGSDKRIYLEVKWQAYTFHICAAPYGNSFYFSWWLRKKVDGFTTIFRFIPFIGKYIIERLQYKTYSRIDTESMFITSVSEIVQEAIARISSEKGIKALSETEKEPHTPLWKL